MKKADVPCHRTRSRAVYYTIANELISKSLINKSLSYTDLITVIEMRDDAKILFE